MKIAYEAAFLRDLKRVRSKKVHRQVQRFIEEVKRAFVPHEIACLTKLLEKAFEEATKLSELEQNTLARWLIDEKNGRRHLLNLRMY